MSIFAVSTFDAVGGLVIGAGAAIWLIVDGLVEQWRNPCPQDRRQGILLRDMWISRHAALAGVPS